MKHLVKIDELWSVVRVEALTQGANHSQLLAIYELDTLSEQVVDVNPCQQAELDIELQDGRLSLLLSETDQDGSLIANGHWTRLSIDRHGASYLTTSHDPEFVHVLAAPV